MRYADDCNIYVKSRRAGERLLAGVGRFLERKLKPEGQREEERSRPAAERKFLSFSFYWRQGRALIRVAGEAERCLERLRRHHSTRPVRSGGRGYPSRQRIYVGMGRVLSANGYGLGVSGTGRVASAAAAADALEALEERADSLPEARGTGRAAGTRGTGRGWQQSMAHGGDASGEHGLE